MLLPPRRPGARSDAFPRGYGCYRTATQTRKKTFPARGTSAQSFTPPPTLPTFPKRRSPSGAPGSVATGDLSYTREASSLHGMRKRPTNLSHARGASVTPSAGQPCKKPFPCGGDTGGSGSRHSPPLSYARGGILHNTLIILEECSISYAHVGHIPRHLRERSGHPLSYARGGASSAPSGYNGNVHTSLRARGIRERSRAYASSRTFPTRGAIAISSLPAFLCTRDRARNREARQHHAGPFRAGPFRLRGKVRVPLPFGSGLPVCRVLPPPRSGTDGFCPPPGGSSASARFPHSRSFHRYSAAFTRRHTVPDRLRSGRGTGSDRH